MLRNSGSQPNETRGRRIRGVLANGIRFGFTTPDWSADTARWSRTGNGWDLDRWEIVK